MVLSIYAGPAMYEGNNLSYSIMWNDNVMGNIL